MRRSARRGLWWTLSLATVAMIGVGLFGLYRTRPLEVAPVESEPPTRPDEMAHLEGGFSWSVSRDGAKLLDLLATSMVAVEGGVQFLRDIGAFKVYLSDGSWVTVKAPSGRVELENGKQEGARVFLEGGVVAEDPNGSRLEAESIVYETATRRLLSPGAAHLRHGKTDMRLASFQYDTQGRTLVAHGPYELDSDESGGLHAEGTALEYDLAARRARFVGPLRIVRRSLTMVAPGGSLTLPSAADNGSLDLSGPVIVASALARSSWQLVARSLSAASHGGAAPQVDRVVAAELVSMIAQTPEPGGFSRGAIHGPELVLTPTTATSWRADMEHGFKARWTPLDRTEGWDASGLRLHLEPESSEPIGRISAEGSVVLHSAAGGSGAAERLEWRQTLASQLELYGSPARVAQGSDSLEAPRITLDRERGLVVADGGVLTEFQNESNRPGLFGGSEPIRVRSPRATLPQEAGEAVFSGPVQAWQTDSTLRAGELRFDRAANHLHAQGDVLVRRHLVGAGGATRQVRVAGTSLDYDGRTARANIRGNALYEDGPLRVAAESMLAQFNADNQIESLTASESVSLTTADATGTGDRLEWSGGDRGLVLLVGIGRYATLKSREAPPLRGQRLRYDLATKLFAAEPAGGKTVIEGIVPPTETGEKKP